MQHQSELRQRNYNRERKQNNIFQNDSKLFLVSIVQPHKSGVEIIFIVENWEQGKCPQAQRQNKLPQMFRLNKPSH